LERAANLPTLLWTTLSALDIAHSEQGAGRGGLPSLEMWSNAVRAFDVDGVERRRLPVSLRLSKRAVRANLIAAARRGWAEEMPAGPAGRRTVKVRLTAEGAEAAARWEPLRGAAEAVWGARAGTYEAHELRRALEDLVSRFPLEHPHFPAAYGAADATVTGGNGREFSPVYRQGGGTVASLPLSALVSQALTAFAMAYEQQAGVALWLSALVLRRVPPEGRSVRDLGRTAGLSALERHGYVRAQPASTGRWVQLTDRGRLVSDAYERRIDQVERDWGAQYGQQVVGAVRHGLERISGATAS
jgi:hypothetical protein